MSPMGVEPTQRPSREGFQGSQLTAEKPCLPIFGFPPFIKYLRDAVAGVTFMDILVPGGS